MHSAQITKNVGYHLLFLLFASFFMPIICIYDPISVHNSFASFIFACAFAPSEGHSILFLFGFLFMGLFIVSLLKIYYDKHKWMVIPLAFSVCDIIMHIIYTFTVNIGLLFAYGILSPIGLVYKVWRTYVFYKYYIHFRNTTAYKL
ncbi:MAG: hypothetical protein IKM61_06460 [Eubacteriaceae bacterium]|nr:hypothetical protein [Eubacteriaceae bacterium]